MALQGIDQVSTGNAPPPIEEMRDTPPAPDIQDVVPGTAAPADLPNYLQPAPQGAYEDATSKAVGIQQLKLDADQSANAQLNQRAEKLRSEQQRNLNAEHWSASQIPEPWDPKKERAETTTGPMEKFGSAAMVFAGIASAFSKTPAISSLNAGAAVLQAINDGDEKAYRDAHAAWKENTEIAIKRFNMQRDIYSDTNALFDKDISQWKAKLIENATRFGDQQALNLLQHGQYDKFFEAEGMRAKAMESMIAGKEHFDAFELRRQAYEASVPEIDAALDPNDKKTNPLNVAVRQLKQAQLVSKPDSKEYLVADKIIDLVKQEKRWPTSDELTKFDKEASEATTHYRNLSVSGAGGNPNLTTKRQIADQVGKKIQEWRAEKNADGTPKYMDDQINTMAAKETARLSTLSSAISGNQRDKLAGFMTRADLSTQIIDDIEESLVEHQAMTGLGGTLTRPMEAVGNWFGSDETARAMFATNIAKLREWETRLMNEASARPLSQEEKQAALIVRGLSMGDTTANTAAALLQLRDLFTTLRQQWQQRYEGTWSPEQTVTTTPGAAPSRKGNFWDADKPK